MKRILLSFAFLASTLTTGCGAPEVEPADPISTASQALLDPHTTEVERRQNDPTTALCNGDCCWFRCTRNSDWKRSSKPVCGTCRAYAQYACPSLYDGEFIEFTQKWEFCGAHP